MSCQERPTHHPFIHSPIHPPIYKHRMMLLFYPVKWYFAIPWYVHSPFHNPFTHPPTYYSSINFPFHNPITHRPSSPPTQAIRLFLVVQPHRRHPPPPPKRQTQPSRAALHPIRLGPSPPPLHLSRGPHALRSVRASIHPPTHPPIPSKLTHPPTQLPIHPTYSFIQLTHPPTHQVERGSSTPSPRS